ncbi:MAG: ABC-F family ATP-binding cassette domain-containing protein [Verrucomicrobiaceae bacterium]|nr:ABC-F family ATP-binding cassette domain-containing protein [Verrucomicrobiaceae bacterium]
MLTIKKMTKALGGRVLFEEADMTINWGERVALVGPNGAGKTTLFKIILGEEDRDSGTFDLDEYGMVGYLAQEAGDPGEATILEISMGISEELQAVMATMRPSADDSDEFGKAQDRYEELNGYQLEPKAKKILAGLGYAQEDFGRPANMFSGGWVMRAHLARLLVEEPDLLMLDEPTNHLDLHSLMWFQKYLQQYPGALLIISHDRSFMDGVIEKVYEIDEMRLVPYAGNYTKYLQLKEERYDQQLKAFLNQKKEISRIQEFIDKFRSVGSKASQVQSRVKMLEKMERLPKPRKPRKLFHFHFPQPPRSTQRVISLENVSKAYDDNVLYTNLDVFIERGDRIVLVGPNGSGKSTLMKMLAGIEKGDAGKRNVGTTTKIGYFSQHRAATLNENNSVLEEVVDAGGGMRENEARSILGSFLFKKDDVQKRVGVLSGGEKSRLSLVKFLVDPPNLLLMDEPTTHLDMTSIEALVSALKQYEGTLVFISHDVHFIRSLAEHTWHVADGEVKKYSGGYDYYLQKSGAFGDDFFDV